MNIAIAMLSYLAGAAALATGLAGGVALLARPGDARSVAAPPRVAPIPPRIADSIERKKPIPQPPAAPPAVAKQIEVGPTMHESNVALSRTPMKFVVRELPAPPKRRKKQPTSRASAAAFEQGASTASRVTTARSDNPY